MLLKQDGVISVPKTNAQSCLQDDYFTASKTIGQTNGLSSFIFLMNGNNWILKGIEFVLRFMPRSFAE